MGSIGGLLGTAGGAGGSGFAGPASATILNPATTGQADTAYTQNQQALQQQQALLNAIQGQNGLGNQSSVFNQLQGVANGQGPNPAQAQLAQATGANVANQAALAAGQRGASQNVGLLARQAANAGANAQQQSAGQAATLQANQSLNALNQLGGIANQQAANQIGATGAVTGAQQAEQGQLLGAIQGQNQANVSNQASINAANAGLANTTMQGQQALIGGGLNAAGAAMGIPKIAQGGKITAYMADGGDPSTQVATPSQPVQPGQSSSVTGAPPQNPNGPKSRFAQSLKQSTAQTDYGNPGANAIAKGMSSLGSGLANAFSSKPAVPAPQTVDSGSSMATGPEMMAAKGGTVKALVSPGEVFLEPKDVESVKKGADPLQVGEKIPGTPKYPGNDYRNDIVPKNLKEGGIVIPNEVLQSKHPSWGAKKFVEAHLAKGGLVTSKRKK